MPTLAELRAQQPRRDKRAFKICLAPDLVAEVQSLAEELGSLAITALNDGDDDDRKDGPPDRIGAAAVKRRTREAKEQREREIRARMAELLDEMAKAEGELRVRAVADGEWRRWVNEHPPRQKDADPAGYTRDLEVAGGYCNADDLIDDLAPWAYSWDGEVLGEGDWAVLAASVSRPDKKQIARGIVGMHEQMGADLPKWRAGLSATLTRLPADDSPAPSDAPPASSLAESPQSDTSTTTPTTD